ncbi:MAG: hypothetical protein QOF86_2937 [Baekduia sp.]|jgi:hypothetical protein|nr:hypothetical protein [Baekduia sp.]
MSVLEPLWMTEGAWETIGDQVVGPAAAEAGRTGAADAVELAALEMVWREATHDGARVAVWISPRTGATLAGLLDAHPELAGLLAG